PLTHRKHRNKSRKTVDTNVDLFRIKIWNMDNYAIIYDNQVGADDYADPTTAIGSGNIVIHSNKKKKAPAAIAASPDDTCLLTAYPNPFNPDVWVPYILGSESRVTIRVHDMLGRLVRALDLGTKPAGFYTDKSRAAYWDGKNEAGEQVSSGVYFYTIQAGDFTATKKMVVAK
ncbi:T9SS type A sorting domain-containing protein, partial [Candidatus Poribacteria bacterium]